MSPKQKDSKPKKSSICHDPLILNFFYFTCPILKNFKISISNNIKGNSSNNLNKKHNKSKKSLPINIDFLNISRQSISIFKGGNFKLLMKRLQLKGSYCKQSGENPLKLAQDSFSHYFFLFP